MQGVRGRRAIEIQHHESDSEFSIALLAKSGDGFRAIHAETCGTLMGARAVIEFATGGGRRWRAMTRTTDAQAGEHGLHAHVVRIALSRCRGVGVWLIQKDANEKTCASGVVHPV